jgi:hypothetical protein
MITTLKNAWICLLISSALIAGCTSNENKEEQRSVPSTIDSNSSSQPIDTPRAPQPNKGNHTPAKKTDTAPAKKVISNDWRSLVKEYREILCRQHNGVSTTNDKVRLSELTKDFSELEQQLPASERSDFISEKSKAIETEDCK